MALKQSLSGRLLMLTVGIVMLTALLVFLPSVAEFRNDYIKQRLHLAELASLSLLAAPSEGIGEVLEREVLESAGVDSIVLRRSSSRQLILQAPGDVIVSETYDLRSNRFFIEILDAFRLLLQDQPRTIRILGSPLKGPDPDIEITMAEPPLRREVIEYAGRITVISFFISSVTGALIYFITGRLIVRPIENVVESIVTFQQDPENAPVITHSHSSLAEIIRAEGALADLQKEVKTSLRQKSRLAALGGAVSKISHDLRNILASAQLLADRLEDSKDPLVARIGPKLINSIDRATTLCATTLQHGKAEEAAPVSRVLSLHSLISDVAHAAGAETPQVFFINETPEDITASADPDHLYRIFNNLLRNAGQAIAASGREGLVTVSSEDSPDPRRVVLTISDNGPGMPQKAVENIFQPFRGGVRRGGAGLGLSIAFELAQKNGCELELVKSDMNGTTFRLVLRRQEQPAEDEGKKIHLALATPRAHR